MAYELRPRNVDPQSAASVARLLMAEFAHVKVDAEEGMREARARAEWIERAPAAIFLGQQQKALETAAGLRSLTSGEAATIEFGDSPINVLRIVVIPGETIKFGYRSNEEQAASTVLVERCARVLECDVVVI